MTASAALRRGPARAAAVPGAGVVVVGMHRSGTSATARIVNLLGIPIGDRADLKPPSGANRKGYWESNGLTAFNDRLLHLLGGSWAAPPRLAPGWESHDRLALQRRHALHLFSDVHEGRKWVWKDPRTSVTLPFWLRALRARPAVVLTYRQPLEVASSLAFRSRVDKALALAIWERYMRAALASVRGLPVFVVPYDGLVLDPAGWCARLLAFLERHGIACRPDRVPGAARSVDRTLRHHAVPRRKLASDRDITREQLSIVAALESRIGEHRVFRPPAVPDEPDEIERLLATRRGADLASWSDAIRRGPNDRPLDTFAQPAALA